MPAYTALAQINRADEQDAEDLEAARAGKAELLREMDLLLRKHRPADATDGDVTFAIEAMGDVVGTLYADTLCRLEESGEFWGPN